MNTIVAVITPPGRSGIGVLRLSGANSLSIIGVITGDVKFKPQPRRVYLKKLFDPQSNELIDEALITYFKSPQSFTGEDIIEISTHGSPVILRRLFDICLALDARAANPGEFSLRALANGRINLSQAEAIRDLINAQTTASARQAVRQLRGEFSASLQPLKDELLETIVILESNLEFVEDDLPQIQVEKLNSKLREISEKVNRIASTFHAGRLLREGLKIALIGRPNVGKSSVFNVLIGQERAIVTDIAGTTRDSLHESINIQGIPVYLIDTAGLRETADKVELIGVERTKKIAADADLILAIFDGSQSLTEEDQRVLFETENLNRINIINKIDLEPASDFKNHFENLESRAIFVSAKTGQGFDALNNAITSLFSLQDIENKGLIVSDARHYDLLRRAVQEIDNSTELLNQKVSEEIILVGLHNALRYLGEITGETTTEDMLTKIFSTFCIGK